jgi:F-type H+-transporting ATPase subunit epsilon
VNLTVLTPDRQLFDGEVESSTFPGSKGSFQILKGHAAIISALDEGILKYKTISGEESSHQVSGGVVEASNDKITVLVEKVID